MLDPAMFLVFDKEVTRKDEIRRPSVIAVTHVDDVLHAGYDVFDKKVMKQIEFRSAVAKLSTIYV